MAQTQRVGTHKTTISDINGMIAVTYHNTVVIKWNDDSIVLDSGGWRTYTTKMRINQASNQYRLGIALTQKKGEWFVNYNGNNIVFTDGMTIDRNN